MDLNELELLLKNEFNLTSDMLSCLNIYYSLLKEKSEVMNLTTIKDLEGIYIKHFYDALLLSKTVDLSSVDSLLDVGTGAGIPGIILKICYPHINVTLLEPTLKRCTFLKEVINAIKLDNIDVVCSRAEEYIYSYQREKYDLVCARAVSKLNMLLELLTPFAKVDGLIVPYKGSSYNEEVQSSIQATKKLNIKLTNTSLFSLPNNAGERCLLVYKKIYKTNDIYPRLYSKIKKTPL